MEPTKSRVVFDKEKAYSMKKKVIIMIEYGIVLLDNNKKTIHKIM